MPLEGSASPLEGWRLDRVPAVDGLPAAFDELCEGPLADAAPGFERLRFPASRVPAADPPGPAAWPRGVKSSHHGTRSADHVYDRLEASRPD